MLRNRDEDRHLSSPKRCQRPGTHAELCHRGGFLCPLPQLVLFRVLLCRVSNVCQGAKEVVSGAMSGSVKELAQGCLPWNRGESRLDGIVQFSLDTLGLVPPAMALEASRGCLCSHVSSELPEPLMRAVICGDSCGERPWASPSLWKFAPNGCGCPTAPAAPSPHISFLTAWPRPVPRKP